MAYPTTLDSLVNPTATDKVSVISHALQHSNANDAIEALEAKVGVTSSAVTTSHDYKLSEVTSTDVAVGKSASQTLTNKTLTTPTIGSFTNATHDHTNAAGGGQLSENALALTDITTNNVSATKHGFAPKFPNNTTTFLRGDGAYATPPTASVTIVSATTTTLSLTTTAGQKVIVWAKGDITGSGSSSSPTISLKYNGVTKDTVIVDQSDNGVTGWTVPFSLMYTEEPGAATQNVTVTTSADTLNRVMIIAQVV